ncbi:PDZ domain-containing protein [Candidatus Poribacteria bacterium]|nr:PDZ domain-containing protein [Candidatus Poribacteria bacterium]
MDNYKPKFGKYVIILVIAFLGLAVYYFFEVKDSSKTESRGGPYFVEGLSKAQLTSTTAEIDNNRHNAIVMAVQKAGPCVVSVSTLHVETVEVPWFDSWFEDFYPFGRKIERKSRGLGSGFIIDKRGYVITNQHVIENADVVEVTLTTGEVYKARVLGADYEADLSVLKIDPDSDLPIAELGDSSDLMVGEWAIAIGSPFGFLLKDTHPTVTVGVISALNRPLEERGRTLNNLIQTDAAINPGNSGGPLVNSYGQVIGINTAIFSTSGGSQGIGFAMPINTAKDIINELIKYGSVVEVWVGLEYQQLTPEIAEHLDSPVNKGLIISDVVKDSPAHDAGLKTGDIVFKIGEKKVNTTDDAQNAVEELKKNGEVVFHIVRKGKTQEVPVTIELVESSDTAKTWFGISVQNPDRELAMKYNLSSYNKGVIITEVEQSSAADEAELRPGDLIRVMSVVRTSIFRGLSRSEDTEIKNINDFRKFVSGIRKGQRIKIIFERKRELWQTYLTAVKNE